MMVSLTSPNIISLPGLILQDMAELRKKDQEFKAAKKRLKKDYRVDKISRIYEKNIHNSPSEFKAALKVLIDPFVDDFNRFTQAFIDLFNVISETLNAAEKEEFQELVSLDEVMEEIRQKTRDYPGLFYMTKSSREKFSKEFERAMKKLADQIATDYSIFRRSSKGKQSFLGLMSKIISKKSAERQGLRAAAEIRTEVNALKEISRQIEAAMRSETGPNILLYLLQYVTQIEKTDQALKWLKKDVEIIYQDSMTEVEEVANIIGAFFASLVSHHPECSREIENNYGQLEDIRHEIESKLGDLTQWPKFQESVAEKIKNNETKLLVSLKYLDEHKSRAAVDVFVEGMGGSIRKRGLISRLFSRPAKVESKIAGTRISLIGTVRKPSVKQKTSAHLKSIRKTMEEIDWEKHRKEFLEKSSVLAKKNIGAGYSNEYFPTAKRISKKLKNREQKILDWVNRTFK